MEAPIDGSLCNICTFFSIVDELVNRAHRRKQQGGTENPM
jgi:hypothetical protein